MDTTWQPLGALATRLQRNLAALATRSPALAKRMADIRDDSWCVRTLADDVQFGRASSGTVVPLASAVSPAAARNAVGQALGPAADTSLVIAGIDKGWLWQFAYTTPVSIPRCPGHRPPLFFLARDEMEFWRALHVHAWEQMLTDPRVYVAVGADAVEQFRDHLLTSRRVLPPRRAMTVDAAIWPAGVNIDMLFQQVSAAKSASIQQALSRAAAAYSGLTKADIVAKIRSGKPLRVLGITSRYTTFLQHSMRDWLDAFARAGHETNLIIESADHELLTNLDHAEACAEFRPDLIVMIDHFRGELSGLTKAVPCVMWVQDHLPNIYDAQAGALQGELDFCVGFGRLKLSSEFGYPAQRFVPTPLVVNEQRFSPRALSADDRRAFACDVSYVSHASTPADVLVAQKAAEADNPLARKLFYDVFERLRAVYDAGGSVTDPVRLRAIIDASLESTRVTVTAQTLSQVVVFFSHTVNNALFRHQTLMWLADSEIDLRLYGRGWENHKRLGRFARGVADNADQLAAIYQATRINLQITPHGAMHQRLLDGLASGAFFLIRYTPGDVVERIHQPLWHWCQRLGIRSDEQLRHHLNDDMRELIARLAEIRGVDPLNGGTPLFELLRLSAETQFMWSAATVFSDYDAVAFNSQAELAAKVTRYLADEEGRRAIAASMRKPVLERLTYSHVNRRLLNLVAQQLSAAAEIRAAA